MFFCWPMQRVPKITLWGENQNSKIAACSVFLPRSFYLNYEPFEKKLVYFIRYKGHLLKEQGHLYTCHLNFYKVFVLLQKIATFLFFVQGKKVLKEVSNFFTYLLQRMSRLSEGIHHLKVVGQKIR